MATSEIMSDGAGDPYDTPMTEEERRRAMLALQALGNAPPTMQRMSMPAPTPPPFVPPTYPAPPGVVNASSPRDAFLEAILRMISSKQAVEQPGPSKNYRK